jgi:hypothetical protein
MLLMLLLGYLFYCVQNRQERGSSQEMENTSLSYALKPICVIWAYDIPVLYQYYKKVL